MKTSIVLRTLVATACLFVSLSASAADTVRSLVEGGTLSQLRWPDVSDYRKHLDGFYRGRNDALAWTRNGQPTAQAIALTRVFAAADAKGVNAIDYDSDRWGARLAGLRSDSSPEALARFDVAMTATLMRYISDLHIGRVNPTHVEFFLDVTAKKYDLPQLVASLVDAADIAKELEAVEPQYAGYRRLRDALARYNALAAEGDNAPLPDAKIVEPGDAWAGVGPLAALLRRVGDLGAPFAGGRYEGALVDAVKRFQLRHGLTPDGRIGKSTLAALNVPLSRRAEQIRLSMERWRWAPSEFEAPPIVVNVPEFRLRAFDGTGKTAVEMNVVVGGSFPGRQTPVFAETMEYVVFRPYWNVPPSIQSKELMPKVRADKSYLSRNGYEMVDGRIRQKPGPKNALGNIKFMLPNPMNIYLHDTPSRDLFSRERRDFSHGCIRLGDPAALAAWVLRDQEKWTPAAIDEAMKRGPVDTRVNLRRPIPVLIVYATAVAPDDGTVRFFDDIYGHDRTLVDALGAGYPYPW